MTGVAGASARPPAARRWRAAGPRLPETVARRPLVLASTSPRRRELLTRAGIAFAVADPGGDPRPQPHLRSWRAACAGALHKAAVVVARQPGRLVLAADTVVVDRGQTLGKPRTAAEAERMLAALSGRSHRVYTAFCLAVARPGCAGRPARVRALWLEVVRSRVRFRTLSAEQIRRYVASGAPFDKAGGYGVQDHDHALVESVAGCYYNVVGLPLAAVGQALGALGWRGPSATGGRGRHPVRQPASRRSPEE